MRRVVFVALTLAALAVVSASARPLHAPPHRRHSAHAFAHPNGRVADPAPASLKLWFGESALQEVAAFVEPLLVHALHNITAPDQKISALGIVVTLSDIVLQTFNLSAISVSWNPPTDITLSMNDLQAVATMNWDYTDGPGIDWSGSAVDYISNTQFAIDLTLGSTGDGKLSVSTALSASVGSLDIQLSGSGSSFFQVIVNMITPVLVSVFQSVISGAVGGAVTSALQALLASIPIAVPLLPGVTLNYGLIRTANAHALSGQYYPDDNSFGGSSNPVSYAHFDSINIDNYQSYDVSGFYVPATSGAFTFRIEYDQRAQLDVNGQSIGGLEMHNPGMCWPEHSAHTTNGMTLSAGQFYPLRLRYQSGCGGGWLHLKTCDGDGNNCVVIDPMALHTLQETEFPVAVLPVTNTLEFDSAAGVTWNGSATDPYTPKPLPATFVVPNNTQMLQVELEQYVFDSMIWSIQQTGAFFVAISPLTTPPTFAEWALNTTTWKALLPGLYAQFPDQLFSVFMAPTVTPQLTIDPALGVVLALDLTFNISMSPYPIHWGSETVIQIDGLSTAAIELDVKGKSLVGACTELTVDTLKLVYADVPVFNVTDLLPLFNLLTHDIVQPLINKALAKGIPLPVLGPMTLVNPQITYLPGVLALATDFEFSSSDADADAATAAAAVRDAALSGAAASVAAGAADADVEANAETEAEGFKPAFNV